MANPINPAPDPVRPVDWRQSLFALVIFILAILVLFTYRLPVIGNVTGTERWIALMILVAVALILIGYNTNGQLLGALIDSTNHMSLSKLQIILWTILTLSAYLVIVVPRIFGSMTDISQLPPDDARLVACHKAQEQPNAPATMCASSALQVTFPEELIAAMGISAASFVGSSLIQNNKKKKKVNTTLTAKSVTDANTALTKAQTDLTTAQNTVTAKLAAFNQRRTELANIKATAGATDDQKKLAAGLFEIAEKELADATTAQDTAANAYKDAQKTLDKAKQEQDASNTQAEGILYVNEKPSQANWLDLFRGSEIGNYQLVDIGKVQMFLFTIVLILAYAVAVIGLLNASALLAHPLGVDLPPFSESQNVLLGVSHAAYLGNKLIDHTPTVPEA